MRTSYRTYTYCVFNFSIGLLSFFCVSAEQKFNLLGSLRNGQANYRVYHFVESLTFEKIQSNEMIFCVYFRFMRFVRTICNILICSHSIIIIENVFTLLLQFHRVYQTSQKLKAQSQAAVVCRAYPLNTNIDGKSKCVYNIHIERRWMWMMQSNNIADFANEIWPIFNIMPK